MKNERELIIGKRYWLDLKKDVSGVYIGERDFGYEFNDIIGDHRYVINSRGTLSFAFISESFLLCEMDSDIKPDSIKCDVCGKEFNPGDLVNVMVHMHSDNLNPAEAIGIKGTRVKPEPDISRWPDEVRLKMIEKSEFYSDSKVYQYGFYDGYQLQNDALLSTVKRLQEENEELKSSHDETVSIRFFERLQEENEQLKEEKNELVGMRQLVAEIVKWTQVKDGRAIFTTSEETFRVYEKYLKSSELNKEEH